MNIINAQVEVLKEALKGKRKHTVMYGTLDNKVIIGNEIRLYVIPKEECVIDLTNIAGARILQQSILENFVNDNECTEIELTNGIRLLDSKITARILTNGKENIYLDERLIKNFDLKNATFKSKGAKSIVYIYEGEVMVGFCCPINVK